MLIKAIDGTKVNTKLTNGSDIIGTDVNHFTIIYYLDWKHDNIKPIATYRTKKYALKALKELEATGKILSDGRTNNITADEIWGRLFIL